MIRVALANLTEFGPGKAIQKRRRERRPKLKSHQPTSKSGLTKPRKIRRSNAKNEVDADVGNSQRQAPETKKPLQNRGFLQWLDADSNRGHMDFQSIALPTELSSL